eukprot:gene37352-28613_t
MLLPRRASTVVVVTSCTWDAIPMLHRAERDPWRQPARRSGEVSALLGEQWLERFAGLVSAAKEGFAGFPVGGRQPAPGVRFGVRTHHVGPEGWVTLGYGVAFALHGAAPPFKGVGADGVAMFLVLSLATQFSKEGRDILVNEPIKFGPVAKIMLKSFVGKAMRFFMNDVGIMDAWKDLTQGMIS